MTNGFEVAAAELVRVGRMAAERGWVPATSGNFSLRLGGDEAAITVSGAHKGDLSVDRIMRVDLQGRPLEDKRPSAETQLHVQLYRRDPAVRAVFHTHSVGGTVLSRLAGDELVLAGFEVMKAFAAIDTHETTLRVPVFANDQDMTRLATRVAAFLDSGNPVPGYLIAGHGLYTWGASVAEALRHLEAFEFLFQCDLEMRRLIAR
ncbi:MAG: methylthioribulose 1-phosphate dehydratase [Gammaproteobacteria bacterium]|nr:methylthioribulose 1-phosphate dehydratase [Gammaproteobacteria bacterium]